MAVIDMSLELRRKKLAIRENVRMFKHVSGMTNDQLAAATGLTSYQVQARTMKNADAKNAASWDAAELDCVASALRVPVHILLMEPEDAWQAALELGLLRPSFGHGGSAAGRATNSRYENGHGGQHERAA